MLCSAGPNPDTCSILLLLVTLDNGLAMPGVDQCLVLFMLCAAAQLGQNIVAGDAWTAKQGSMCSLGTQHEVAKQRTYFLSEVIPLELCQVFEGPQVVVIRRAPLSSNRVAVEHCSCAFCNSLVLKFHPAFRKVLAGVAALLFALLAQKRVCIAGTMFRQHGLVERSQ